MTSVITLFSELLYQQLLYISISINNNKIVQVFFQTWNTLILPSVIFIGNMGAEHLIIQF